MGLCKIKLTLIYLLIVFHCVVTSKLNVPRVLLPIFSDFSTKFTLEAIEGGCYKWITTRSDIISLEPILPNLENGCSTKVVVNTITKEETRNLAVVLAEDVNTGQILKCDVIVDVIASLSMVTKTRELFMEEVPVTFQVVAKDSQGNEFSTLEGVEFEWNILSTGPNTGTTVLRYLKFKDSLYESPPHIEALEDENKQGYMILLEGIKTGSARISVRLPYPEYKHVESFEVILTVVANLLITPADVYIMPGDIITYKLFYMHSGRMDEIFLPDAQYYLVSENQDIAVINEDSNELNAVGVGRTKVVLRNRNVEENDANVKLPSATVNVVVPAYMTLTIHPHKNWVILIGDHHDIHAEIFSITDHKLHLGPGIEIKTQISDAFHIENKVANGSWFSGWGVREATVPIESCLEVVKHPRLGNFPLNHPIKATAELYIYPRISILPKEVILPWDPVVKPKYTVPLVAKGGDGRFLWSSNDNSVGSVTQSGIVRTHGQGYFEVTAAMLHNHHNFQVARFSILPPDRLEIVEYVMEAEIGTPIYLHIALYAENSNLPFTQCQDLPFQIRQSDNKFRQNKSATIPPIGRSCGNIAMVGVVVGSTKVTVTYYQEGKTLEDSVTITAFSPLKLIEPHGSEIVMAVGSSMNLIYIGGPRPIIGRISDHQVLVESNDTTIAVVKVITEKVKLPNEDNTALWVLCKKLGYTTIKLVITNLPTLPNCRSKASVLESKIYCGKVRRLQLQPEIKVAHAESCPMDLSADRVVVQSNHDIELDVTVMDNMGRKLLNITSLLFHWELKPIQNAIFGSLSSVFPRNITYGDVPISYKNYQIIKALRNTGIIEVRATVLGYQKDILKKLDIQSEYPEFLEDDEVTSEVPIIEATIGLYLVDDTKVEPNKTKIYAHPNNIAIIQVKDGSGFYEIAIDTDEIAEVDYKESKREIEIKPLKAGELTIQLVDLCLVSRPAFIKVTVISVQRIEVEMSDKVEITRCIKCIVRLYDQFDKLINLTNLDYVIPIYSFTNNIAAVQILPQNNMSAYGEIHYTITGIELGDTQLQFIIDSSSGDEITSEPQNLQVFSPLRFLPRNVTLIIGAKLQLQVQGGPEPDAFIEYNATIPNITEIDDVGLITGLKFGSTKIIGKAIGIHPTTGCRIVYSEDIVDVYVIAIVGIKISAPLTRFKSGALVPVWISGIPEQISPMILGSVELPNIEYIWEVEEDSIVSLNGIFNKVGIHYQLEDRISQRLLGLLPGKTSLNCTVVLPGKLAGKRQETIKYVAKIEIEIVEALKLIKPKMNLAGRSLLMAPYSSIQIETNLDPTRTVSYSVGESDGSSLIAGNSINPTTDRLVTISPKGLIEAHGKLGRTMLLVIASDDKGLKQYLSYVIEVKPVHYMMMKIETQWRIHIDHSHRVLPLGSDFYLTAVFYDEIGSKFTAGPKDFNFRASRYDLIRLSQKSYNLDLTASVQVATKKPGVTVFKAWSENSADYVKIHVDQVVKPALDHLTSGDIICLWSPVVDDNMQFGSWNSSDEGLVVINENINLAYIVAKDNGFVKLTYSLQPSAPLELHVWPVSKVLLSYDHDILRTEKTQFVTNGPPGTTFTIAVSLHGNRSRINKNSNLIQGWHCKKELLQTVQRAPFQCHIHFSNESFDLDANVVFEVERKFIHQTGQYACQIIATDSFAKEISIAITNLTLWAISDNDVESAPLQLPFVPNVYIANEVYLDENSFYGVMDIIGLDYVLNQVVAQPADSSILYVDDGYLIEPTIKRFKIQLIDYHWRLADIEDAMGLIVKSPMTQQEVRVMVKVSGNLGDKCSVRSPIYEFIRNYYHAIIIVISMIIIFFLTFYVYSHYMYPVVNVNVQPMSPNQARSLMLCRSSDLMATPRSLCVSPETVGPSTSPMSFSSPYRSRASYRSHICTSRNCPCGNCPNREPGFGDATTVYNTGSPNSSPDSYRRTHRFL